MVEYGFYGIIHQVRGVLVRLYGEQVFLVKAEASSKWILTKGLQRTSCAWPTLSWTPTCNPIGTTTGCGRIVRLQNAITFISAAPIAPTPLSSNAGQGERYAAMVTRLKDPSRRTRRSIQAHNDAQEPENISRKHVLLATFWMDEEWLQEFEACVHKRMHDFPPKPSAP